MPVYPLPACDRVSVVGAARVRRRVGIHVIECNSVRHTTASDGAGTVADTAEAAARMGYGYIAITDHSQSSTIANGLGPEHLRQHIADIRAVDGERDDIRVLTGIEVDILADGTPDLPHALLAQLDWVVGSVHAAMKQDAATMTARLLAAIETGVIDVIGHPTGRRLGERDGYTFDFEAVIAACLKHGVALELNSSYGRLDLDDVMCRQAARAGVVISTDAHSAQSIHNMAYGVGIARRAWLTEAEVLNTRPWEDIRAWRAERLARRAG